MRYSMRHRHWRRSVAAVMSYVRWPTAVDTTRGDEDAALGLSSEGGEYVAAVA